MFGRQHLERALKAEARAELLERDTISLETERNQARREVKKLEEHIFSLKAKADEVDRLREENHELDKKNAVLLERLDLVANYGMGTSKGTGPNTMPEEAEDAMFAYRAGLIPKDDLEKTLAQAGFDNAEIEFDAADYPRLNSQ